MGLRSSQSKLLELAVLGLETSFEFLNGLTRFNCCGAGNRANDTRCGGLRLVPVQADMGFGFHLGTQVCIPFIILLDGYKTTIYQ